MTDNYKRYRIPFVIQLFFDEKEHFLSRPGRVGGKRMRAVGGRRGPVGAIRPILLQASKCHSIYLVT